MPDTTRKIIILLFILFTKNNVPHPLQGIRILLKNHWISNKNRIHSKFLEVAKKCDAVVMGDVDRQIFDEDQLDFHNVLTQATVNVEAAFAANNGTLRAVVNNAIKDLEDAFAVFEQLIFV